MDFQIKVSPDAYAALLNMQNADRSRSDSLARLSAGERVEGHADASAAVGMEYTLQDGSGKQTKQPALSIAAQNRAASSASLAQMDRAQRALNLSFREVIEQTMLSALTTEAPNATGNR